MPQGHVLNYVHSSTVCVLILTKLGSWGPWGRVEVRRKEARRGTEKNVAFNKKGKKEKTYLFTYS